MGTDTAIYGVSTILGRFLTFLLTPIYANILIPADLGIVATVYAYIAFLNVVYGYGLESAYMKYASTLELGDKKTTFTIPFVSVAISSLLFSLFIAWRSDAVADLINLSSAHVSTVRYAAWILLLDAVALVPFASLRMAGKAKRFASIKLAGIVINVVCNIVFLAQYHMGIHGIFLSGVISSACTLILLLPTIVASLSFVWSTKLYAALLHFGLPTVPAGIASMMIQVINRPMLEAMTDKSTVGIFQANYRLGIFMMLIVSMYDFAWRPFFLSHAQEADAKQLFARVLTYFLLLMSAVFLGLSFFVEDIVKIPIFMGRSILPAPYWEGLSIVPVVLLGYVFLGISNNVAAGFYIEKQTKYLPIVTFIGAGINVAVNYLLIPSIGMMGAALATLFSYAVMAVVLYVIVQRFYPVPYEFGRIAKITLSALIVFVLFATIRLGPIEILWKFGLLLLFGGLIYGMRFFEPTELKRISGLWRRGSRVAGPVDVPPDVGA